MVFTMATRNRCQVPLLLFSILCIISAKAFLIKSSMQQVTQRNLALRVDRVDERFKPPMSVAEMMQSVGQALKVVKDESIKRLVLVDIPLPVTSGTELDDWPGGIKQKYTTLRTMLVETMKGLGFSTNEMSSRNYIGTSGEDDAVGIWKDKGYTLICFPNLDSMKTIRDMITGDDELFALINEQTFSEQNLLVDVTLKEYLETAEIAYYLRSLNMRGPSLLPVRGILYRKYPDDFKVARRLDNSEYVLLKTFKSIPSQGELEVLFFEDSKERDKDLSLFDRLKKQIPNFGN